MAELHRRGNRAASPTPKLQATVEQAKGSAASAAPDEGKLLHAVGMRTWISWLGALLPVTVLNFVVPAVAFLRGDIKMPNILISDVMSAHQTYEAVYTWGFCIIMLNVCFVLREVTVVWRREMPEKKGDIARFIALLYAVVAPCLFGVVAFQYKHDGALSDIKASKLDFVMWLLHCGFASVLFLSASIMAVIYGWRLHPALEKKHLVHPADHFWRMCAVYGMTVSIVVGAVVRYLHLFHSTQMWAVPLLVVEVVLIQLMLVGVALGATRDLMSLDASDPIFHLAELFR